ncbi:MAG: hypothetical protein AAGA93_02735 [Actinomycetota bacterium]
MSGTSSGAANETMNGTRKGTMNETRSRRAGVDTAVEGTTSERRGLTHLARNLLLLVPLALAGLGVALATGQIELATDGEVAATVGSGDETATPTALQSDPLTVVTVPEPEPAPPSTVRVELPVPGASRLVADGVRRIVDTRQLAADTDRGDLALPPPTEFDGGGDPVTALVLSVSVLGTDGPGTVTIDCDFGSIDAVTVGGAGATTTGLVVVPGREPSRLINPTGGDLVVDLVGTFVASGATAEGRFVSVDPVRVGGLVTATDGREGEIDLGGAEAGIDSAAVTAALVLITADVGDDGGRIGVGPAAGALDQMLMWGPPASANRQRSGVVLVAPGDDGSFALRYDGGSVLDVDLIGYVTGADAPVTTDGLFVPASTILTIDRTFPVGTTIVEASPAGVDAAFVGVRAEPGGGVTPPRPGLARDLTSASGRTIGTVFGVGTSPDGRSGLAVSSQVELSARLQIFGHFLDVEG